MFKLFLVLVRVGGVVIFGKAYLYNVGVIDTIHGNLHLAGAAFVEKEPLGHVGRRHHRRKRRRLHLVGVGEYLLRVQLRRLLRLGRRRGRGPRHSYHRGDYHRDMLLLLPLPGVLRFRKAEPEAGPAAGERAAHARVRRGAAGRPGQRRRDRGRRRTTIPRRASRRPSSASRRRKRLLVYR